MSYQNEILLSFLKSQVDIDQACLDATRQRQVNAHSEMRTVLMDLLAARIDKARDEIRRLEIKKTTS